jgi:alpha-ketoglutarate-dependent taurine dioxygenase
MRLYTDPYPTTVEHFPDIEGGIQVLDLEPGLGPEDIRRLVGNLVIPSHFDVQGNLIAARSAKLLGDVRDMKRSPNSPPYPYARDHFWHTDLGYWSYPDEEDPFATVLYPRLLEGPVADTEFIDTGLLLEFAEKDKYPGITEIFANGITVLSAAKYYTSTLPARGSVDAIQNTLNEKAGNNLAELAIRELIMYPPKTFRTISKHPFSEGVDCIWLDEPHTVDIIGANLPKLEVQEIIAGFVREYLALPPEELAGRPYYEAHTWEEGQAVVWSRRGTLHRAGASPDGESTRNMLKQLIK